MVYAPSANWTTAATAQRQSPVYYIAIDGIAGQHYSTAPVKSSGTTKDVRMNVPSGGAVSLDIIAGTRTVQTFEVELLDIGGEITDLVATEATGAPVSTLINRKVTIYAGYRSLAEADYAAIFVGRITAAKMNRDLTGFVFTLADTSYLLDGEIMTGASETEPATIRGNVVNVYWSILTGTFSTVHATFPLDSVSTYSAGVSSAPTGLGIATALINETQLVEQRDTWHSTDVVEVVFSEPESAREHLADELFRVFQCWPAISGAGLLGLRFHVPALPASAAPVIDSDDIIEVESWERMYGDHLNKFRIDGDYDPDTDTYTALYDTESTEDTDDQTATGETIEYHVESRWLSSTYDGEEIATELAGRMRIRYLKTPAKVGLLLPFANRNLEEGDVVAVTHAAIPNLLTGARGATSELMTIIGITPDFEKGLLKFVCLDTGYKRYGVIAPETQVDFTSATALEKSTFFFICDEATGLMSDSSEPYRLI